MINFDKFFESFAPEKCSSCGSTHIVFIFHIIWGNSKGNQQFHCEDCGTNFHVYADYEKWLGSTGKGLTPFTSSGNMPVVDGCGSGSYSPRDSEPKPKSWIKNVIETGLPEGEKEATGHDGSLTPTRSRKERLSPNSGFPYPIFSRKCVLVDDWVDLSDFPCSDEGGGYDRESCQFKYKNGRCLFKHPDFMVEMLSEPKPKTDSETVSSYEYRKLDILWKHTRENLTKANKEIEQLKVEKLAYTQAYKAYTAENNQLKLKYGVVTEINMDQTAKIEGLEKTVVCLEDSLRTMTKERNELLGVKEK